MGKCEIGLYGLGVMGASLAKNMINNSFDVCLYSKSDTERNMFFDNNHGSKVCSTEQEFVNSIAKPRKIFLMITAGNPVDMVIDSLLPLLDKDDIIMDGGNSFFKDTNRRQEYLKTKGIKYLGVGVSGGELGALNGPSMMIGGDKEAWESCRYILEKISAKCSDGAPCCDYLGLGGAGHFVKMVHNGIEYALLQIIADVYSVMTQMMDFDHNQIVEMFKMWNETILSSYLIEITIDVLSKKDNDGTPLVSKIKDIAKYNGTGNWTLEQSLEQGIYTPSITEAVYSRLVSSQKENRIKLSKKYPNHCYSVYDEIGVQQQMYSTISFAFINSYIQGLELIKKASSEYKWNINLRDAIALWREGCIIRSQLLPMLMDAVDQECDHILLSDKLPDMAEMEQHTKNIISQAVLRGIAIPTLTSTLMYYNTMRTADMNVNIVQGLRDCFGAHRYERVDIEGSFHTDWQNSK